MFSPSYAQGFVPHLSDALDRTAEAELAARPRLSFTSVTGAPILVDPALSPVVIQCTLDGTEIVVPVLGSTPLTLLVQESPEAVVAIFDARDARVREILEDARRRRKDRQQKQLALQQQLHQAHYSGIAPMRETLLGEDDDAE